MCDFNKAFSWRVFITAILISRNISVYSTEYMLVRGIYKPPMKYNEIKNKHGGIVMDTSYEDKMYRQIEKSLSNNINDKLFVPIEMIDRRIYTGKNKKKIVDSVSYEEDVVEKEPVDLDNNKSYDDRGEINNAIAQYKDEGPRLSRAEYIIQAREACLRQMNSINSTGRTFDYYGGDEDAIYSSHGRKKREKVDMLFNKGDEEALPEEIASFKSLIIRTVCAIVIFLSIFIIDKVKVDWGVFSYETIRQYVTGNNQLKALEEIIVSWLK